jgi:hypothetical protein
MVLVKELSNKIDLITSVADLMAEIEQYINVGKSQLFFISSFEYLKKTCGDKHVAKSYLKFVGTVVKVEHRSQAQE